MPVKAADVGLRTFFVDLSEDLRKPLRKWNVCDNMIKIVIFDIDNTLYSYDQAHAVAFQALLRYAERELGMTREEFKTLHQRTNQELKSRMGNCAAIHNRLIRYQNMLERKDLPLYPHVLAMNDLYWDTLLEAAQPSPGALETMRQLKAMGLSIGIGTDMTARLQFQKLTRLGLLPYVDFLVSSEEAQAEKPAAALFNRCVEKAGAEACECLFVGDSLKKDVQGANAAGLHGVWYCPEGAPPEQDVLWISALEQLVPLAGRL